LVKRALATIGLTGFLLSPAWGQAIQQSGNVTPGHVAQWTTNGVVQDGGTAANNTITSLGATGPGPVICANSAPVTLPYYQLCLDASDGLIAYQSFGGATPQALSFSINGVTGFPVGSLAPIVAGSFVGNPTAGMAAPSGFAVSGLTANVAPNANLDYLVMWNHTTNTLQKINAGTIASSATSGVSSLGGLTGALTCGTGLTCSGSTVSVSPASVVTSLGGLTGAVTCGGGLTCAGSSISAAAGAYRVRLSGATTFYLNVSTGIDSAACVTLPTSIGTPCKTLLYTHTYIANNYDTQGQTVTLQLADGTYAPLSTNLPFVGQGGYNEYQIIGNCGALTNVVVQGGSGPAFSFGAGSGRGVQATVTCVYAQSTGGNGVEAWGSGTSVATGNIYFATAGCNWQAAHGAELSLLSGTQAFSVQANGACLINAQTSGRFVADSPNITFQNSPTFSLATVYAVNLGSVIAAGGTFTGGSFVHGQRYAVQNNGLIATGAAGANYFPGTSPGLAVTGGTYN
jgi:hypothetical protein